MDIRQCITILHRWTGGIQGKKIIVYSIIMVFRRNLVFVVQFCKTIFLKFYLIFFYFTKKKVKKILKHVNLCFLRKSVMFSQVLRPFFRSQTWMKPQKLALSVGIFDIYMNSHAMFQGEAQHPLGRFFMYIILIILFMGVVGRH